MRKILSIFYFILIVKLCFSQNLVEIAKCDTVGVRINPIYLKIDSSCIVISSKFEMAIDSCSMSINNIFFSKYKNSKLVEYKQITNSFANYFNIKDFTVTPDSCILIIYNCFDNLGNDIILKIDLFGNIKWTKYLDFEGIKFIGFKGDSVLVIANKKYKNSDKIYSFKLDSKGNILNVNFLTTGKIFENNNFGGNNLKYYSHYMFVIERNENSDKEYNFGENSNVLNYDVIEIDDNFNIINTTKIVNNRLFPKMMLFSKEGNILILRQSDDWVINYTDTTFTFLQYIDNKGNEIWNKKIENKITDISLLQETDDNNFMLIGNFYCKFIDTTIYYSDCYFEKNGSNNEVFYINKEKNDKYYYPNDKLIKINKNGDIILEKDLNQDFKTINYYEDEDKNLYFIGVYESIKQKYQPPLSYDLYFTKFKL
jgi:hypothetical protein